MPGCRIVWSERKSCGKEAGHERIASAPGDEALPPGAGVDGGRRAGAASHRGPPPTSGDAQPPHPARPALLPAPGELLSPLLAALPPAPGGGGPPGGPGRQCAPAPLHCPAPLRGHLQRRRRLEPLYREPGGLRRGTQHSPPGGYLGPARGLPPAPLRLLPPALAGAEDPAGLGGGDHPGPERSLAGGLAAPPAPELQPGELLPFPGGAPRLLADVRPGRGGAGGPQLPPALWGGRLPLPLIGSSWCCRRRIPRSGGCPPAQPPSGGGRPWRGSPGSRSHPGRPSCR